ncbi:MAG: hypothetical protein NUV97_01270 [archaeon]|nr:hypothetical protein [archaeon]MCR4323407.1 hypothetical protein [Nanoarchaeota archaeon]
MPQKIDSIGRAHEWTTASLLDDSENLKKKSKEYLNRLSLKIDQDRVILASKKASEKIRELVGQEIKTAKVVGEENKKQGGEDFDILLELVDGSRKGYSLKTQNNFSGVNVRNFTPNSLCKIFTGKGFEDFLDNEEKKNYLELGDLYSKDMVKSEVIGKWGAQKLAEILSREFSIDKISFVKNLLSEMRGGTNLLLTVVNKNGEFKGYCTKFSSIFEKLRKEPENLRISFQGISVLFYLKEDRICKFDIYMQSTSSGKKKKLRGVIRIDFIPDNSGIQETL